MKKSLIVAAALVSTTAAVHAEELFVNIHSGSAMAQGAGLVLAGQALEQKATVRVLLCDAAGDIALVGKEMPTLKPRNVTPQQPAAHFERRRAGVNKDRGIRRDQPHRDLGRNAAPDFLRDDGHGQQPRQIFDSGLDAQPVSVSSVLNRFLQGRDSYRAADVIAYLTRTALVPA